MSDREATALMGRYCAGEAAAFQALYNLLAGRVLAYLVGLVGDRAAAEDLVQQTFLKVHEARDTYVRGANPVPWIFTIAHRTCLDELRRRRRARVGLFPSGDTSAEPCADLEGRATEGEPGPASPRLEAAMAALKGLPRKQREALLLTKLDGRSVNEAAAAAGTTPGAIKLRAHRAYVTLRHLLAGRADKQEPT
jgi:RNA polymerase sigma-70 factor (ECF subfamily)